jgi:phenylpropionate dioxygenase-like ring-hydroxylating dioxygenase large terminal subunit
MLTHADNERLTRVGPDTPGGRLLRRHWFPVLQANRLVAGGAPQQVKLLGETFVAFRKPDGTVGVIDEGCPHRRASMMLARNEACGLRCIFHGWVVDVDGRVVETPSEPADRQSLKDKAPVRHYPVREVAGLLWLYIGGGTTPRFPDFPFAHVPVENTLLAEVHGACNWVQLLEGQIDSAHLSHLHASSVTPTLSPAALADKGPRFDVETTPWGMHVAATRVVGEDEHYTRVTEFVMPNYEFIPRAALPGTDEYERIARFVVTQVPLDDVTTIVWYIMWHPTRALQRGENGTMWPVWNDGYEEVRGEAWCGQDRTLMAAGHFSGLNNLLTEDMIVGESMGPIVDRSKEYLGTSDTAVARFRRLFLDALRDNDEGRTPRGSQDDIAYQTIQGRGVRHRANVDWRDATEPVGV